MREPKRDARAPARLAGGRLHDRSAAGATSPGSRLAGGHSRILHALVTKPADRPGTVVAVDAERIFDGPEREQRRAAEAVRGPVCILAGAGPGKTTTITRRIA